MKVLVFGADGFIGRNVCLALGKEHEVIKAVQYAASSDKNTIQADLLNQDSIRYALKKVKPETIVNCAGIVGTGGNMDLNVQFTKNILEQAAQTDVVKKVIICGSAGEYGQVSPENIPVSEDAPLNANSGYGLSKLNEERFAIDYGQKHNIQVVVLRIFNPIGKEMAEKFLLMKLLSQVKDFNAGERDSIELTRLDSKRDYVSIKDVASAFKSIVGGNPRNGVYNVGSGTSTTNGELLELILKNSKLDNKPQIKETSNEAEPLVAIQADITRISNEFGWRPVHPIDEVIREICS
ncbi:MAG TPA: NAD(P)-dependent oxidoreductase [Candidatus Saccharimonadales bacterium]|nr:NAD(P)-dependent oxidoreductase [Candidatus Saccharimonadales bacterium]